MLIGSASEALLLAAILPGFSPGRQVIRLNRNKTHVYFVHHTQEKLTENRP